MTNYVRVKMVSGVSLLMVACFYLDVLWRPAKSPVPKPCGFACQDVPSAYLINTPGCVIPDFPMSEILSHRRKAITDLICSKKSRLTEQEGQHLLLYKNRAVQYNLTADTLKCEYQTSKDIKGFLGESKLLLREKMVMTAECVRVTCYNTTDGNNTIVYIEGHNFIQPSIAQKKRELFKRKFGVRSNHPEKLSVLVMGTDAVSRFNAIRNMPNTFKLLMQELGALDFQGYNKIGENTLPNTYAFMTGYLIAELNKLECVKDKITIDTCPIAWNDFDRAGYVTAYGKDITGRALFTYVHNFARQPVDYFLDKCYRHMASHGIPHSQYRRFEYSPCKGSKSTMRIMHDHALALAEEMKDIPYFGFYWSSSLTHDALEMARAADMELMRLITQFRDKGYLNHTAVFIISDHGLRYGPFRHTYLGMVEEKLPFVFALFPPWFKTVYPEAWSNLVKNTKRLTSNYDLHQTLHSLADAEFVNGTYRSYEPGRGQSLFTEIPDTRICTDVGIPERHCSCEVYQKASIINPYVTAAATAAIRDINLLLRPYPQCAPLQLHKVLSARLTIPSNNMMPRIQVQQVSTYLVEFQSLPGEAMLEALVRRKHETYTVVGQVLRTNMYGNQSHCLDSTHLVLRTFCYCTDLLQQPKI